MRRRANLAIVFGFALLLLLPAMTAAQAEDVYSERTLELSRKLACPVCEGQSIADSQSRLAREMKQTIESQVQTGMTDEEIIDFFVARFGEEVLLEPPQSGLNLTLWWIPFAALIIGGIVVALYLRDNLRPASPPVRGSQAASSSIEEDAELEALADDVLGRSKRGHRGPMEQGAE